MALPRPVSLWLWLGLCLCASLVQAAPEPAPKPDEIDADFLDFLGSWQNDSGRWVDPFEVTEELPREARPTSKDDTRGPATSSRTPLKGREPNRNSNGPREPMRMQPGP